MYQSLKEHTSDFHLYIFAFDDLAAEILFSLRLEKVTIITLEDFETPELKEVKKERTKAEYCWTCTPSTISYVLDTYEVQNCTYIDADLYFYSDPSVLISEMEENKKNILIIEHRFSTLPRLYERKRAGRFCVQFITFLNKNSSLEVLEKWKEQCIDWCYARYEDGKFGDQKYLDEWPELYPDIHVLENLGGGVAPWNLTQYRFVESENSITGIVRSTKKTFKVIFFHFQYVKFLKDFEYDIGWFQISSAVRRLFYVPYLIKIIDVERNLANINSNFRPGFTNFKTNNFKNLLKTAVKIIFKYNIMKVN